MLSQLSIRVSRKRFIHTRSVCLSKVSPPVEQSTSRGTARRHRFTIPAPTWSISSLRLHESHPPASSEELQILAKRAVLDVRQFNDVTKQQLCQDLGNMLHMMNAVQNFQSTTTNSTMPEGEPEDAARMMYDIPRGVTEAPFRMDDDHDDDDTSGNKAVTNTTTSNTDKQDNEEEIRISHSVRESYLEPKMKRVGGHQYFETITSIQPTNKNNQGH